MLVSVHVCPQVAPDDMATLELTRGCWKVAPLTVRSALLKIVSSKMKAVAPYVCMCILMRIRIYISIKNVMCSIIIVYIAYICSAAERPRHIHMHV